MSDPLRDLKHFAEQPHYGVLVQETESSYEPAYDRHDQGGYVSYNVVKYCQFLSQEALEAWLVEAHAKKLTYRVIKAWPVKVELKARVDVSLTGDWPGPS